MIPLEANYPLVNQHRHGKSPCFNRKCIFIHPPLYIDWYDWESSCVAKTCAQPVMAPEGPSSKGKQKTHVGAGVVTTWSHPPVFLHVRSSRATCWNCFLHKTHSACADTAATLHGPLCLCWRHQTNHPHSYSQCFSTLAAMILLASPSKAHCLTVR